MNFALALYAKKQLKEGAVTWQEIRNILDDNLKKHGHDPDEIILSMEGIEREFSKLIHQMGFRLMDLPGVLAERRRREAMAIVAENKPVEEKKVVKVVVRRKTTSEDCPGSTR